MAKPTDKDTVVAYHEFLQGQIKSNLSSLSLGPARLPFLAAMGFIGFGLVSMVVGILVITIRHRHVYLVDFNYKFVGPFFILLFLLCLGIATFLILIAKRKSNKYRRELTVRERDGLVSTSEVDVAEQMWQQVNHQKVPAVSADQFRPLGDYGVAVVHKSQLPHEQQMREELKSGTVQHPRHHVPRSYFDGADRILPSREQPRGYSSHPQGHPNNHPRGPPDPRRNGHHRGQDPRRSGPDHRRHGGDPRSSPRHRTETGHDPRPNRQQGRRPPRGSSPGPRPLENRGNDDETRVLHVPRRVTELQNEPKMRYEPRHEMSHEPKTRYEHEVLREPRTQEPKGYYGDMRAAPPVKLLTKSEMKMDMDSSTESEL